jgi:hypothetical protein
MTLEDLIDLEAQLERDRERDPAAIASRDRGIARGAALDPARPHAAVAGWLRALRADEPERLHPGHAVARALGVARAALAAAGLVLGWGTAAALLRFEGPQPVNVWDFLLVLVGGQILLLAALVVVVLAPSASHGVPLLGGTRAAAGALVMRLATRSLGGTRAEEWRALAHRLRTRRSLYRRLEPWLLLGITQAFGVAFNVGVLLATLRLVVFSDVAFSWGTTLGWLDAGRLHAAVRALATPWAWLWPDAVPSEALVAATRYSRLEAAYWVAGARRAADPGVVGAWWPFLVAAVACYGLAPRVVALVYARWRAARFLRRLPLDDLETAAVLRRLAERSVETRSPVPERGGAPAPASPLGAQRGEGEVEGRPRAGSRCALVLWRDTPLGPALRSAVEQRLGTGVSVAGSAGGREHEEGAADWAHLAAGADSVAVLADAWEAPDRGAMRLVSALRAALGPRVPVLVLLAGDGAGEEEVRIWRDGLARLEDPWVGVEALEERAP